MKTFVFAIILILGVCGLNSSHAAKSPKSTWQVRQQMVLFGLYNYGINQELSKTNPDLGELQFLAESTLEVATKAIAMKGNKLNHRDYENLMAKLINLQKMAQMRRRLEAITAAKDVMQACSQCHMATGR